MGAFVIQPGLFKWIPPRVATFIYTVICKPLLFKKVVGYLIKQTIPEEIKIHSTFLSLNTQDPIVSGSLFFGCYETEIIKFFLLRLEKNTTFIDIGANIGLYSALACHIVAKTNLVIAIEPDQKNCELIKKTKLRNEYTNLIVEEVAAGEFSGSGKLFLNALNPADHRLYDKTCSRKTRPIQVETIDNIVKKHTLPVVNLVKIDTQGYEDKVWNGMQKTLRENHKIQIMMEFWPWGLKQSGSCPQKLLDSIRSNKFVIYEFNDNYKSPIVRNSDDYLLSFKKERQHLNLFLARA